MELIENFGIEPILLAAQIVNFLVVLFILKKFLYKPILTLLEERKRTVKQGLEQAELARKLLEKSKEEEKEVLKSAQLQARKLLEETRLQQKELIGEAEKSTKARIDKMLQEAKEQITQETLQVEKRLSQRISKLAVEYLEKAVSGLFTSQDQEAIMKQAIKRIKQIRH